MIRLREFHLGDEPALRVVFESAIHEVAVRDYTQAQVNAWAPRQFDPAQWAQRMQGIAPFVVEVDGLIVAYADVQRSGYIDHFFVAASANGQGLGGRLMRRIHERAYALGLLELTSDVSRTAQPFYKHFGFEVVEHYVKEVRGVPIEYAKMKKSLGGQRASQPGSAELLALSIVAPSGSYIAGGRKTLEVRSWRPDQLPLRDLLIVENNACLTAPGDSDPDGRAVAFVDVAEVRPWLEVDVEAACAREWSQGYWAWVLCNVRPIAEFVQVTAERRLYHPRMDPRSLAALLDARAAT